MSTKCPRRYVIFLVLVCLLVALIQDWSQPGWSVWANDDTPVSGGDYAEIYRRVNPSVVSILVKSIWSEDVGAAGFVVHSDGYIVTNAHVIEGAYEITVEFNDGLEVAAGQVGLDSRLDIAVIKVDVDPNRLKPVTFGNSDELAVGQPVLAIGNPYGLERTLTTGIISGLDRVLEFTDGVVAKGMIQTDAALNPGNSGGPLLNLDGEVIGVNTAIYRRLLGVNNIGFAIPSNLVQRVSANMIAQEMNSGNAGKTRSVSTATERYQPRPTRILPATATPTPTPVQTETEPPGLPQQVEESVPTATSQPTAIVIRPSLPTLTALPTLDQTEVAKMMETPPPRPTWPATWTAAPNMPPTITSQQLEATPAPNLNATPDVGFVFNPTQPGSTPDSQVGVQVLTPTPTPIPIQPTVAVRQDLLRPVISPPVSQATTFSSSGASVYQYNMGPGQVFSFENIRLGGGVRLFLPNPVDANSWIRTDFYGILRFKPIGERQEGAMTYSPFFEGFSPPSIDQNRNRIVELDWSADGQQFSFRIDTPSRLDNGAAGVWFWQPIDDPVHGTTYQIIRDCVKPGYSPCNFVNPSSARHWKTINVQWSPTQGSNSLLLTLQLPQEGRNAIAVAQAVRDPNYAQNAPNFVRYDYGHWNLDGFGITVSGRRPDGRVIIGAVNNDLSGEQVILDASARGLWVRDAVRRPNGQYVALGRPGGPGSGPLALYDGNGNQLTGFIGDAAPEAVRWYPIRSLVVVTIRGRQYTVQVEGGGIIDSTDLLNNPHFSASGFGSSTIPSAVVAGSEYYPGQQLRTIVPYLNIRQAPTSSSGVLGQLVAGDHVAILAGPHQNEGYRWWQVQSWNNIIGWIAGTIAGNPTISSF